MMMMIIITNASALQNKSIMIHTQGNQPVTTNYGTIKITVTVYNSVYINVTINCSTQ